MKASPAEAGEVLLSELSCLACHADGIEAAADARLEAGAESSRVPAIACAPEYVREFLAASGRDETRHDDARPARRPAARRSARSSRKISRISSCNLRGAPHRCRRALGRRRRTTGQRAVSQRRLRGLPQHRCRSSGWREKYAPGQLAHFLAHPLEVRPARPHARSAPERAGSRGPRRVSRAGAARAPHRRSRSTRPRRRAARRLSNRSAASPATAASARGKPLAALAARERGCLAETPGRRRAALPALRRRNARPCTPALQARAEKPPAPKSESAGAPVHAPAQLLRLPRARWPRRAGAGNRGALHLDARRPRRSRPPAATARWRGPQAPTAPRFENILRGQNLVRDYMRVRMPDFGPELAEHLRAAFCRRPMPIRKEIPSIAKTDPNKVGPQRSGPRTRRHHGLRLHRLPRPARPRLARHRRLRSRRNAEAAAPGMDARLPARSRGLSRRARACRPFGRRANR